MQRIAWAATLAAIVGFSSVGCQKPNPEPAYVPDPLLDTLPARRAAAQPLVAQKPVKPPPGSKLDPAVLLPPKGITPGKWKVIVVHHSANAKDSPQSMHAYHLITRGWENGLGYDFVIGNGVRYPDGQIYVGPRWKAQIVGAHCKAGAGTYFGVRRPDNFFNEHGIGICLIGNFNDGSVTTKQRESLEQLIAFLCMQTRIDPSQVYGHGEVTGKTECPGRTLRTQLASVKRRVAATLAMSRLHGEHDLWRDDDLSAIANAQCDGAVARGDQFAECDDVLDGGLLDALDDIAGGEPCACCRRVFGDIHDQHAVDPLERWRELCDAYAAPEDCSGAQCRGPFRLARFDDDADLAPLSVAFELDR